MSVCNDYGQYSQQMVPSELMEQLMAWFRYLPPVILLRKSLFRGFRAGSQSLRNVLSQSNMRRVNPGSLVNTTETVEENIKRIIAATMANMEWGEDISYMKAAFLTLPFSQQYISFSNSKTFNPTTSPTTTNAAISLFFISLPIEHLLSAIGMTILRRYNITVSHHDITVFNDCSAVNPVKTEKSKLFFLTCLGSMGVIMIAMAEL